MSQRYKIPRGTYDILPQDSYKRQYLMDVFRRTADLYNYREIVTPMFESADLFERSVGDTSDIVQKEMYVFEDRKERRFALRPEGTAPVVRSFVENGLPGSRLYYMGAMFRYDRPQKGRYRQFYQYGLEAIGSAHPYIDAEVIALAVHYLESLGLKDFRLEINSVGGPASAEAYNQALKDYYSPHVDELCEDCRNRMEKNPRRLLDCKIPTCKVFAKDAPVMLDYLDDQAREYFEKVKFYLDEIGIEYHVNPHIVRGLDYYTDTAFEILDDSLGAQNALLGGGRYNGLVEQIGGKDVPGIGFAGGFERLTLSMEKNGLSFGDEPHPEVFLVAMGETAEVQAVKVVNQLRLMGIPTDFDIEKGSFKSQMKAANKSGAGIAIIIGDDEIKNNTLTIKDMRQGTQETVSAGDIKESILKLREQS